MQKTSKTIVFFGNEKLATGIASTKPIIREAVERAGFQIEQVVTGKLADLRLHSSELAVLAAYGRIIPQSVLDQFPRGIINVHPSLLPQYRGPTPIEQAMLDGVTKTGVSIMRLTAGMDEGPIYKQRTVHLTGRESKVELVEQLHAVGAELLVEVLPAIASGKLKPRIQPHPDRASYSHKLTKADGAINWAKPADQLEREVRAYSEWPKSTTTLAGKEVILTKVSVVDLSGKPGQAQVAGKQLIIYAGDKALEILRLKPAGKPEMTAAAFLAGYGHLLI
jgi:methionyl-tRNA formyltransferase